MASVGIDSSASPPTRANLKDWWKQFNILQKATKKHHGDKDEGSLVFGAPLKDSLRYASVQISTANADGRMYVWGYIPVVVAKCGLYLKEYATETEGVFRVSGSSKRMKELQAVFETPPRYGKSLDWKKESYTTHDVASVFRRYLTMMPEPVVPSELYHEFRNVYKHKTKADDIIQEYKRIIKSMPRGNQYLLLYVLDLLSVFARKSEKNLMTASNLAVIFRPGILRHPDHDMQPSENELSQQVLEFLIKHQDWFMLDIPPPPKSTSRSDAPNQSVSTITNSKPETDNEEDVVIVPSSDEEQHTAGPANSSDKSGTRETVKNGGGLGGWKLISRRSRRGREKTRDNEGKVLRSKSNVDRRVTSPNSTSSSAVDVEKGANHGELSPVEEKDADVVLGTGTASVGRSRTLPSSKSQTPPTTDKPPSNARTTSASSEKDKEKDKHVLKKKARPFSLSTASPSKPKDTDKDREKARSKER